MTIRAARAVRPARPSSAGTFEQLEPRRLLSAATAEFRPVDHSAAAQVLSGEAVARTPFVGVAGRPQTAPSAALIAAAPPPTVNVTLDKTQRFQTWDGSGASFDTWKFGGSYDDPAFYNDLVGDVGVNIVRVALWQGLENANDNGDPNVLNLDGFSSKSLAPALQFVQQFQKRSPDLKVLASVWTPPYWMKTNGAHNWGGTLRADMYEEFAEYLTAYVKLAKRDYGVDIDAISLQNEPFFIEWYESAVYTPGQILKLMKTVQTRFDREGISTRLVVPEDLNYYDRFGWWADTITSDPQAEASDFIWGTHVVPGGTLGDVQGIVRSSGKPLWLTESGGANTNDWNSAIHLSDTIANLMNKGDLSAFLDWQFDGDGHSSLYQRGVKMPRYYALKHYSHFIRPGDQRVGLAAANTDFNADGDPEALASGWINPATGAETVVLTNKSQTDAYFHVAGIDGGGWKAWASDAATQFAPAQLAIGSGTVDGPAGDGGVTVRVPARGLLTLTNAAGNAGDPVAGFTPAATGRGSPYWVAANDPTSVPVNHAALESAYYDVTRNATPGNIQAKYANGRNALFLTAASARYETVRVENWLIDQGSDPNDRDVDGITPTMVAASNPWIEYGYDQNISVLKLKNLVDRGGSLTAKDYKGRTALDWAATTAQFDYGATKAQDPRVVNYLLSAGADKNKVDRFGKRPADWAAELGNDANLAALNAWTGDTTAPQILNRTTDLGRNLQIGVNFDETLAGMTPAQLQSAVRLHRLAADGTVAADAPYNGALSALPAGNTRLDVLPNPYRLADGYYRLDAVAAAATPALRDSAGNAFDAPLDSFWFLGADANRDKVVNLTDFSILRGNYGKRNVGFAGGDFDFDGTVGASDYAILRKQFGKRLGAAPVGFADVPVPGTPPVTPPAGGGGAALRAFIQSPPVPGVTPGITPGGRFLGTGGRSPFGEGPVDPTHSGDDDPDGLI